MTNFISLRYFLVIFFVCLSLLGCAATDKKSSFAELIETGEATLLSKKEYTDAIVGNTVRDQNGNPTLYRNDGVKLIKILDSGSLIERKWYKDDEGVMCQTLFKDSELYCFNDDDTFEVARSGSTIYTLWKGKFYQWEIAEGNADNL